MKTRYYSEHSRWGSTFYLFLTLCCWLFSAGPGRGQIAEWTFENISSAIPGLPIAASYKVAQVDASATLAGGNNNGSPDACSGNESWSTNFWPTADSRSTEDYLEFSVRAQPGERVEIDYFSFSSNASSENSAGNFDVYYSKNNFTTSTYLFSGTQSTGSCSTHGGGLSTSLLPGSTIRFRIYPYGQNVATQAATIRLDNVMISGIILPVSLSTFTARQAAGQVRLQWTTATEVDNHYFSVERSPNGITFEEIGRVAGFGNSQSPQHYTFYDPHPLLPVNYYRLRQVDFSGREEVHPIVSIQFEPPGAMPALKIWPTAVQTTLNVLVNTSEPAGPLVLRDMNGRLVRNLAASGQEPMQTVSVRDLAPGWYVIQLLSRKGLLSQRFFKR